MKLDIAVFKAENHCGEIRIADPPFDTSHTVSLSAAGKVFVSLHSEEQVDVIRKKLELNRDDWFDCIQWSIGLDALVADFVNCYRAGGELKLDDEERAEFETLAERLESAAEMVRSVLADARTRRRR